jgi:hypothetical protein
MPGVSRLGSVHSNGRITPWQLSILLLAQQNQIDKVHGLLAYTGNPRQPYSSCCSVCRNG